MDMIMTSVRDGNSQIGLWIACTEALESILDI